MLGAQGNDELLVGLLLAALVEDTHVGLAAVEGLGGLAQTTGKTVVDQRDAEDTLQSVEDGHLAAAGVGRNLDLIGGGNGGVGLGLFSVRLCRDGMLVFGGFELLRKECMTIEVLDTAAGERMPAAQSQD